MLEKGLSDLGTTGDGTRIAYLTLTLNVSPLLKLESAPLQLNMYRNGTDFPVGQSFASAPVILYHV